jgi:hypothetical protein
VRGALGVPVYERVSTGPHFIPGETFARFRISGKVSAGAVDLFEALQSASPRVWQNGEFAFGTYRLRLEWPDRRKPELEMLADQSGLVQIAGSEHVYFRSEQRGADQDRLAREIFFGPAADTTGTQGARAAILSWLKGAEADLDALTTGSVDPAMTGTFAQVKEPIRDALNAITAQRSREASEGSEAQFSLSPQDTQVLWNGRPLGIVFWTDVSRAVSSQTGRIPNDTDFTDAVLGKLEAAIQADGKTNEEISVEVTPGMVDARSADRAMVSEPEWVDFMKALGDQGATVEGADLEQILQALRNLGKIDQIRDYETALAQERRAIVRRRAAEQRSGISGGGELDYAQSAGPGSARVALPNNQEFPRADIKAALDFLNAADREVRLFSEPGTGNAGYFLGQAFGDDLSAGVRSAVMGLAGYSEFRVKGVALKIVNLWNSDRGEGHLFVATPENVIMKSDDVATAWGALLDKINDEIGPLAADRAMTAADVAKVFEGLEGFQSSVTQAAIAKLMTNLEGPRTFDGKRIWDPAFSREEMLALMNLGLLTQMGNISQATEEGYAIYKQRSVKSADLAMNGAEQVKDLGGIDLDAAKLGLEIKRDEKGFPLPASSQNWENIDVKGFTPVVYEIAPVNLPKLLGLAPDNVGSPTADATPALSTAVRREEEA